MNDVIFADSVDDDNVFRFRFQTGKGKGEWSFRFRLSGDLRDWLGLILFLVQLAQQVHVLPGT